MKAKTLNERYNVSTRNTHTRNTHTRNSPITQGNSSFSSARVISTVLISASIGVVLIIMGFIG